MSNLRLFIAVDTPVDIKEEIAKIQDRLRASGADVKWEPNEKLHCTLKFLGDTEANRLQPIIESIEGIARTVPPLTVVYRTLGRFPERGDPRVVWIGMEETEGTFVELHRSIDSAMISLGFDPEDRAFHPHVTLGRVRSGRNVRDLLTMVETVTFQSRPAKIAEVEVVKSELSPSGSRYTILKSISLIAQKPGISKL